MDARTRTGVAATAAAILISGCVSGGPPYGMSPRDANRLLLAAALDFQEVAERALAADAAGLDAALAEADRKALRVRDTLAYGPRRTYQRRLASLRSARNARAYGALAQGAVDAYRMLADAVRADGVTVPPGLVRLDCANLQAKVSLGARPPDWPAAQRAAAEVRDHWASLQGGVRDAGLRETAATYVRGLGEATAAQDAAMAGLAAALGDELVGELDDHFREKPR